MARKKKPISEKKRKSKNTDVEQMDQIYKMINRVQTERKEKTFTIYDLSMAPIIENTMRDLKLGFHRCSFKDHFRYKIFPPQEDMIKDISVEDMEEENSEDLQLF